MVLAVHVTQDLDRRVQFNHGLKKKWSMRCVTFLITHSPGTYRLAHEYFLSCFTNGNDLGISKADRLAYFSAHANFQQSIYAFVQVKIASDRSHRCRRELILR